MAKTCAGNGGTRREENSTTKARQGLASRMRFVLSSTLLPPARNQQDKEQKSRRNLFAPPQASSQRSRFQVNSAGLPARAGVAICTRVTAKHDILQGRRGLGLFPKTLSADHFATGATQNCSKAVVAGKPVAVFSGATIRSCRFSAGHRDASVAHHALKVLLRRAGVRCGGLVPVPHPQKYKITFMKHKNLPLTFLAIPAFTVGCENPQPNKSRP
jgi:hypothetical protein